MEFKEIINKAKQIKEKYAQLEIQRDGGEWTKEQIMQGFLGDIEDLKEILNSPNIDKSKLEHELADCLWSIIILSNKHEIDLEKTFNKTMDEISLKISKQLTQYSSE